MNTTSQLSINESETLTNEDKHVSSWNLVENSVKPIGEEYIETTYDHANKLIAYYCKLCECKFNDIKGKGTHLKGRRHRLSYKV